jgi:predicted 3-demethylubiquinone-9 3-methyltransferase (glyoxalase superfamily)
MRNKVSITPFLWFDKEAGEAAELYTSVFPNSKILNKDEIEGTPSGEVHIYKVELSDAVFSLMNAGPHFQFNEAVSFVIDCEDQEEVDYYWEKLTSNGGEENQCGWLKDPFGVSWQVVPKQLEELLEQDATGEVTQAMLKMKKIIINDLIKARNKAQNRTTE